MNFRISRSRNNVLNWIKTTHFSKCIPKTLVGDQLQNLKNDPITMNLVEAPITFPPTYKYNQGTQTFDSSKKQRVPSYTDRILFQSLCKELRKKKKSLDDISETSSIECLVYDSLRSICSSDHKPVYALFAVTVKVEKNGEFNQ